MANVHTDGARTGDNEDRGRNTVGAGLQTDGTVMQKKLIEVALPLDAINAASAREKSIRHGHPSTLHSWWARRPLAAARAVNVAQMVDDPSEYVAVLLSDAATKRAAQRALKKRQAGHVAAGEGSPPTGRLNAGMGEMSTGRASAGPRGLGDLLGKLFSVGGAPTDGSLWLASPRSSVRSDPAGSTRLPFGSSQKLQVHQGAPPGVLAARRLVWERAGRRPRVRVARTSRQQRPFDDGRHRLSHSDTLRDSAEAQRGRITSSRSESSTSATRTIVRNSMFWT